MNSKPVKEHFRIDQLSCSSMNTTFLRLRNRKNPSTNSIFNKKKLITCLQNPELSGAYSTNTKYREPTQRQNLCTSINPRKRYDHHAKDPTKQKRKTATTLTKPTISHTNTSNKIRFLSQEKQQRASKQSLEQQGMRYKKQHKYLDLGE